MTKKKKVKVKREEEYALYLVDVGPQFARVAQERVDREIEAAYESKIKNQGE